MTILGRSNARAQRRAETKPAKHEAAVPRVPCSALLAARLTLPPSIPSPNHLFGAQQNRLRNRQALRGGRLEIDHQLVLCRLLDREVGGLAPL